MLAGAPPRARLIADLRETDLRVVVSRTGTYDFSASAMRLRMSPDRATDCRECWTGRRLDMRSCYCSVLALAAGISVGSGCVARDDTPTTAEPIITGSLGPEEPTAAPAPPEPAAPAPPEPAAPAPASLAARIASCAADPRVTAAGVSVDVCVGADLFLRETFNGNGRSCATCHRVDDNFAIDPARISRLPPGDPLFVAEFDPALAGLEVPEQMRRFGLILENVDGFAPDPRTHFVLRSVPHTLSLATSVTPAPDDPLAIPAERTGWSGDGAPGAGKLRDFQTGAIRQHYTRSLDRAPGDFRLASDAELERIAKFMRSIGRGNELSLGNVAMSDPHADAGRLAFLGVGCNACHGNAGANASFGTAGNRNFNTGVESARHAALAGFPRDGGLLAAPANPDGSFGDGTFNVPPLVEAADTGPFFHTATTIAGASGHNTDVATTIEEAIAFYDTPAFNTSPAGQIVPIDLSAGQIDDIGRFLRGINAAFNAAMATRRLEAAAAIVDQLHNQNLGLQRELLRLARVEVVDALGVLSAVPDLDAASQASLRDARARIDDARATASFAQRALLIGKARLHLKAATAAIGTNLTFQIGEGTVMF
jgi:cytochrome c peroxidase